ncbi:MAG: gamma-glutamylcyclotransferase [Geobacter sp.]|nr:gamma-glutamylcyclotransferase [Geobacter sp.]
MENQFLIFVYGTLRRSRGNHQLLKDAHYYGLGATKDRYAMYISGGYPYVTSSESRYQIVGELYGVDGETLEKLDKMEGHPHYYARKEVPVIVEAVEYSAWLYLRDPHGLLMATGDYNDAVHVK